MRTIIKASALAALAMLLSACAGTQQTLGAKPTEHRMVVVATMATNECEKHTAADYTAATVAVIRAGRLTREGKMQPAQARRLADVAEAVRADLRATCAKSKTEPDMVALRRARAALTTIQKEVQQ